MSDEKKIEPLSEQGIKNLREDHVLFEEGRVRMCFIDGEPWPCVTYRLLADRARLEARVGEWEKAAWTLYGKPNDPVLTMCCRGCHQCRTIFAGTNGDPIVGDMRHGYGCWIEPLLTRPAVQPAAADGSHAAESVQA